MNQVWNLKQIFTRATGYKESIIKSSISSHEINASKNQLHDGIDFLQRIDSEESMPVVLKSSKV
jgi:hypothetical protein